MVAEEESSLAESAPKQAKHDGAVSVKNPGETLPDPLSKNQLKKQRKLQEYEIRKKERRIKERERQKQKRLEAQAQGLPTRSGPSRKALKKQQVAAADDQVLSVAIDLDYDELMSERDVAKCVKQCLRMYTINRRSACPGQLHFAGIKTDGHIHAAFRRNEGWENWHVKYHFDKTHTDSFAQDRLVYLTCESDNVLDQLDRDKVYVIGGLVDHNHHKGLCHDRATKAGLNTARLPLSEHVDMKTRSVLSTFHVFELLVRVAEGKSWTDAILETIPSRKGAKAKSEPGGGGSTQRQTSDPENSVQQPAATDDDEQATVETTTKTAAGEETIPSRKGAKANSELVRGESAQSQTSDPENSVQQPAATDDDEQATVEATTKTTAGDS